MYPLLQFRIRPNVAGLAANSRQATMSLLATMRDERALPDADVLRTLGLEALGCLLERRRGNVPSPSQAHRYMEALANNIPLRRTLKQAAAALHAAGVAAIVYKGQDYVERIYRDLGARSMADVDLLVRERDLGAAEQALIDAGFIADADCKLMHERKFCKDGVAIDLHHALLQQARMRIEHDELFARAVPSSLGAGLLALEATDALLAHCVNQTVKGYSLPASSYIELQALLTNADMGEAVRRSARYQMLSALYTFTRRPRFGPRVSRCRRAASWRYMRSCCALRSARSRARRRAAPRCSRSRRR